MEHFGNDPNNDPVALDLHGPMMEESSWTTPSGSCSVTGPTSVTCTYTPAQGEPPLTAVILEESVSASYTGIVTGSSDSDGFSDPYNPPNGQPNGIGQSQLGDHYLGPYTLQSNSVTVNLNGSGATGVDNPYTQTKNLSTAGVGMTITAYAVTINLHGDTVINGASEYLIGQQCTADISSPLQITNYKWTCSGGSPFASSSYSDLSGSQTPAPADETSTQFSSYIGAAGNVTLHCAIGFAGTSMPVQTSFTTVAPIYTTEPTYTLGTTQGSPSNNAATGVSLSDSQGRESCSFPEWKLRHPSAPPGVGTMHR